MQLKSDAELMLELQRVSDGVLKVIDGEHQKLVIAVLIPILVMSSVQSFGGSVEDARRFVLRELVKSYRDCPQHLDEEPVV